MTNDISLKDKNGKKNMHKEIINKKSQNHYPCDFPRTDEKILGGKGMRTILECQGRIKQKSLRTIVLH